MAIISGNGGNNADLYGTSGLDIIFGRNGHDTLYGYESADVLYGGNGGDTLIAGPGWDHLYGGNGNDTFVIDSNDVGTGVNKIWDFDYFAPLRAMTHTDTIVLQNVGGKDFTFQQKWGGVAISVDGQSLAFVVGADATEVLRQTDFQGGTPRNTQLLDKQGDPISFTIAGTPKDDNITGQPGIANTIAGNAGDDRISGRGKDDFLLGNGGNDEIYGANGTDTLLGGGDDDMLYGGNGGDVLNGDKGSDILYGGNGNDVFQFNTAHVGTGVDEVRDYAAGDLVQIVGSGVATETQNGADLELRIDGDLAAIFQDTTNIDFLV